MAFLLCLKSENRGCALHQPAPLALHRPREHISASRRPRAKPQCPSLPACFCAMQPNKFPFPPYHLNRPIRAMHQPANLDIPSAKETCLCVGKREMEIPIPAPYFSALPVRYVPLYNAPAHRRICTFCQPSSQSIRHSLQAYSSAVPANQTHICRSVCLIRNLYMLFPGSLFFRRPSQSNPYLQLSKPNSKYLCSYSRHLCANSSNILSPVLSSACPPMTQVCTWEHHAHVGRISWIKTNFHLLRQD